MSENGGNKGDDDREGKRRQPRRQKGPRSKDDRPSIWTGYGKLVKFFRGRARLTREQLADAVGYSVEQVASIEQGRRPAKDEFTTAAERVLEAGGVLAELQSEVDRAKLPKFFQDFAGIELEAVSRYDYDPLLVPGLLQTPAYTKALFSSHCPPLNDETMELLAEARVNRQKLLDKTPLVQFSFIIGEAALRNLIGGEEVMREQLEHLLRVGAERNVQLQVIPATVGYHPGLNGGFVLLETMDHEHIGYIESQEVGIVISDPAKVSTFGLRYGKLRSQALNTEESAQFIRHLAGAK